MTHPDENLGWEVTSLLSAWKSMAGCTRLILLMAALALTQVSFSCTIFVLTDAKHTLFCNNEDFSNPNTRIWFVPAGKNYFGCVYVGFDDGVEQGGANTMGLAYDAVAGYKEEWKDDRRLLTACGNPMARMLETCSNVEESIAFFRRNRFPWLSQLKMLVADQSGRSVILGAKQGALQVEEATECRGFGYGQRVLDKMLKPPPKPTVDNGIDILRACAQHGEDATKYSNIFDLKSGEVFLFPASHSNGLKFNLPAELKKGPHYYDMPKIGAELAQAPKPLLDNMKRFFIDRFKPIADSEPNITTHIRAMIQETLQGKSQGDDYTSDFWNVIKPEGFSAIAEERSPNPWNEKLTLVDHQKAGEQSSYRYRVEFSDAQLLLRFVCTNNQVCLITLDGMQLAYP